MNFFEKWKSKLTIEDFVKIQQALCEQSDERPCCFVAANAFNGENECAVIDCEKRLLKLAISEATEDQ